MMRETCQLISALSVKCTPRELGVSVSVDLTLTLWSIPVTNTEHTVAGIINALARLCKEGQTK